jgi:hypothetical protein
MRYSLRTLLIVVFCLAAIVAGYSELLRRHKAWSDKIQMEDRLPPGHPVLQKMEQRQLDNIRTNKPSP